MVTDDAAAVHAHRSIAAGTRPVVFLHVGEPKSGTTFLQEVVWGNRDALAGQGLLLPGLRQQDHFRANQDLRGIEQPADDPAGSWQGEWDVLARQARQAPERALISHELLVGASADQARRAIRSLQPAEVHIVVTVRDVATLMPAEWQETVKHRNTQGWQEYLAAVIDGTATREARRGRWFWTAHDTVELLERWAADLPPEHVHVITMPPRGSDPTLLWTRFAHVLGVDPTSVDLTRARANASLGLPETELLRRMNARLPREVPGWYYTVNVKEQLAHQALARRATKGRLELPVDRAEWAADHAAKTIEGLTAAGYDIVGDMDELRPRPTAGTGTEADEVPAEDVLDAALDAIVALLRNDYGRRSAPAARRSSRRAAPSPAGVPLPDWMKRRVRELSATHPSVRRARVAVWHLTERVRARRAR